MAEGGDSNPRDPFGPNGFQGDRLKSQCFRSLRKAGKVSHPLRHSFVQRIRANPVLAKSINAEGESDASIDQLAQTLLKYPQVAGILKKEGMAAREHVVSALAIGEVGTIVFLKRNHTYDEYQREVLELANQFANFKADTKFVEDHWDEIAGPYRNFLHEVRSK